MPSAYTYDHNTAHLLEPIQGYDLVSFMNFWAPIKEGLEGCLPGMVMHRNSDGYLEPGLEPESMAQFLYSKQDTEDVVNNPVTLDGLNVTSVSMNSFGDFTPDGMNPPYGVDGWGNGVSSNASGVTFNAAGNASAVRFHKQKSVYTTFPGACGLELASSEFARFFTTDVDDDDDNSTPTVPSVAKDGTQDIFVDYAFDMPLTSPCANRNASSLSKTLSNNTSITVRYGTPAQNAQGGFLMPGKHYTDNICGIVSRKPFRNENGTWILCFWACHKPALNLGKVFDTKAADAGKVLKVGSDGSITPQTA